MRLRVLAGVTIVWAAVQAVEGADWTFFRGPNLDGVSSEKGWKAEWAEAGPKVAWRRNVGVGASSLVVAGDKVVTMGNRQDTDVVSCLSAGTGDVIWEFAYPCTFEKRQFEGGTAATPTIDGPHVYTLSYDGQVHCLKLADGKEVWKKNVVKEFGGRPPGWKYAGSPLVYKNLLILDIGGDGSSTLALNKGTGAKVWAAGSDTPGYATPIPFKQGETDGLLVFKAKHLVAQSLVDGSELWRLGWETAYDVNASTPIVLGQRMFISSGYPGGRGALYDLTAAAPRQLWLNDDIKTKTSTAVVVGGHVYAVNEENGKLVCVNLESGQTLWQEGGFEGGTLTAADGKLIVLSSSGELVIVQASTEKFQALARAKVLSGRCWVSPVLSNGRIYCRSNDGDLVCVDVRP